MKDSNDSFQKHMNEHWREKNRREVFRFWLPVGISVIALGVASYSLLLQKRSLQQPEQKVEQRAKVQQLSHAAKTDSLKK
jgi:heme exporter protein D